MTLAEMLFGCHVEPPSFGLRANQEPRERLVLLVTSWPSHPRAMNPFRGGQGWNVVPGETATSRSSRIRSIGQSRQNLVQRTDQARVVVDSFRRTAESARERADIHVERGEHPGVVLSRTP